MVLTGRQDAGTQRKKDELGLALTDDLVLDCILGMAPAAAAAAAAAGLASHLILESLERVHG